MSSETRKKIVIVGGGFAGATLARSLSKKLDPKKHALTLINNRPFLVNLPATIRLNTSPDNKLEKYTLISYDNLFYNKNGTLKVGRVTAVTPNEHGDGILTLESGESVSYDILVLAPGNIWSGPIDIPGTMDEAVTQVQSWRKKFKESNNIIMIGGGAVGIG
jgi:apoptosis-inducing factor 2